MLTGVRKEQYFKVKAIDYSIWRTFSITISCRRRNGAECPFIATENNAT